MNRSATGDTRALRCLAIVALLGTVACQERLDQWVDYRDETEPLPPSAFQPSGEVEFEAIAKVSEDDDSELNVRLLVKNPAADTLRYETGPCFYIVRAYATQEPAGRPLWDHRGRHPRTVHPMCELELHIGRVEPHGSDTLKLIPEMTRGYDRDFPRDPASVWMILNLEGSAHWVPTGGIGL